MESQLPKDAMTSVRGWLLTRIILGRYSRTLKVRGGIIPQADRYLGGFCASQRIFPPQIIQVLLVEHPQDQVKDPIIAQFALRSPLRHREVRQDKCGELRCGELDRDRRRCGLYCRYAHHVRTSCEEYGCALENH